MRLAVIGAGQVGRALGQAFRGRGHQVCYGLRAPGDPKYADLKPAPLVTPSEAAAASEAIVLATPWNQTESAVRGLGNLDGKLVLDCTNPLGMDAQGLHLSIGFTTSGGEMVAGWAKGAAVFKVFNTTGAANMSDLSGYPTRPVMFVAGDDAGRKPAVMDLVRDVGFEAVDAGPLRNARLLEPMAMLWIDQATTRGAGTDFAFALVRK